MALSRGPTLHRAFYKCKEPIQESAEELVARLSSLKEAELKLQQEKLVLYQSLIDLLVEDPDNSNPAFKEYPDY